MSHPQSSSTLSTFGHLTDTQESSTGKTLALTFQVPANGLTESTILTEVRQLPYVQEDVRVKPRKNDSLFTVKLDMEITGLNKFQITNRKREIVARLLCRLRKAATGTPFTDHAVTTTPATPSLTEVANKSRRKKPRKSRGRPRPQTSQAVPLHLVRD